MVCSGHIPYSVSQVDNGASARTTKAVTSQNNENEVGGDHLQGAFRVKTGNRTHTRVYTHIYAHTHTYMYTHVCMCITHMYTHAHTYTHMHSYYYMTLRPEPDLCWHRAN